MVATPMEAEKRNALDEMLRQLDDFVRYVQVVQTMLGILAWGLRPLVDAPQPLHRLGPVPTDDVRRQSSPRRFQDEPGCCELS